VVAQITEGSAFDKKGRPFRRRNYRPAVILLAALTLVTGVIWVAALNRPADEHTTAACNPPPSPKDPNTPKLGDRLTRSSMIDVPPAKLADSKIRVLNASGQGGQAADVAGALRDLGFTQPTAANDPLYNDVRLQCIGHIRFGQAGRASAAAVWLVAPCAELYQDQRTDDSVDLAIGTDFTAVAHSDDINAALASLRPDATTPIDPALVKRIHTEAC
jgi:hypothetical protein